MGSVTLISGFQVVYLLKRARWKVFFKGSWDHVIVSTAHMYFRAGKKVLLFFILFCIKEYFLCSDSFAKSVLFPY